MSYSIRITGRDKEKIKAAVRVEQSKDEANNPHSGVPGWVADHLCAEIDRVRLYQYTGSDGVPRTFGLDVHASGSHHEQGMNHTMKIEAVRIVE